ncbi:hypothetical protein MF271_00700 (plasmid) [Deinococcus sp. KNUC1210]|uniref:CsgG/HfaB family protein n=1 Tax=Deinococcus sp. KNUC1210 TaxID=2917691 RepID=UPI001EF0879E|nr:CsgG/HfaB family protein [Deinococcus sp. KNUC1210]ULH14031.1 hypothetical protein MF271_00700 [Deinococcus sp. KNUC1210]
MKDFGNETVPRGALALLLLGFVRSAHAARLAGSLARFTPPVLPRGEAMKRPLLHLLTALLFPAIGVGLAQTNAPAAPTTAPAVTQASIAIGTFACKTSSCTYELGSATADTLATILVETGRFALYERENMGQLTEENFLSNNGASQNFSGADVLIFGSITQLDADNTANNTCFLIFCTGSKESKVGADLRIVDAHTRRVIAATHVEGSSNSNATSLNIYGFSMGNAKSSGVQTAMADMLKQASNALIQRIPASYYH